MARPRATAGEVYTLDLDGMAQSCVDLSDPTRLHFDYVRRIGDVVDRCRPGPLRVLHVGGAAMTLPRYVAAQRPGSAQIVLEPDQSVIDQVRAEVPLPPRSGIKVRAIDGLAGVAAVREDSQDLVIVDAFRDGLVPPELVTTAFLTDVRRVLGESGTLVVNLADRAPFPLVRTFLAGVRQVWDGSVAVTVGAEPATLKAKRPGNLIVVVRGSAGRDAAVWDRAVRDVAVRDVAVRDVAVRDVAVWDVAGRGQARRDQGSGRGSGQGSAQPPDQVSDQGLDQPLGEPSPTAYRVFSGTAVSDSFGGGRAT